ncbi:MAG TPA: heavy metal translocating P-type ATPase [Chloroflexota bacterium]|nr:heavy metal translocating P-type ATPase [Chloroflexota bacterium]
MSERAKAPAEEADGLHSETMSLEGLDCPDCAASLEKAVANMPGVARARLNYTASTLWVEYSPGTLSRKQIVGAVHEAGVGVKEPEPAVDVAVHAGWSSRIRRHPKGAATVASGLLLAAGFLMTILGIPAPAPQAAFAMGVVTGGYFTARAALFALRSRQTDMNVLMTAAVIGAIAIGEWTEAASVVFLFSLANALQSYTMDRTRRSIRSLLELGPREATLLRDGVQLRLPVEQIAVGDLLLIRPGERIPTDGKVVSGSSTVDQAPITGESVPVEKTVGQDVFAGTINQQGALEVRATRPHSDNSLSRIIHMVEEAQAQKAPSQQFVDAFARYYTPLVILLAVGIALAPPLLLGADFDQWFYRALVLLIIACPCALVISTPVSIASAIATASRHGVLFKGGAYLEAVGSIPVVAFDKTGTLTVGRPEVTDVVALNGYDRRELLAAAAALEARSEHPLAQAILKRASQEGVEVPEVQQFRALPGLGAEGCVGGRSYFVGSARLARERMGGDELFPEVVDRLQEEGKTVVVLGSDDHLMGMVAAADRLRAESQEAVAALHQTGVEHVVLLTGDNPRTAAAIATEVGADGYQAELLPEDKRGAVDELLDRYGRVAMVGDGVNDAPALARSTVGIAMGAAGTDTALETADVALMGDDLSRLPYLMGLSRRTVRTIKENVALSIAVKAIFVVLASAGMANLWMAVLADMGTSLLVIANGMRLLSRKGE